MLSLALLLAAASPGLEDSVVKVQVYSARFDYTAPWKISPVQASSGTGFLIDGQRIVTNAHVVRDARQILIKRHHVANPFLATVEAVADDCDLAILKVAEPAFHEGLTPLRLGRGLPERKSQVTTYGYPAGGQELSSTTGIVSRVEWLTYVQTGSDAHIAVQTDAAINPGNSGGPVIQKKRVVGVAFQGAPHLQNVGYFIPVPVLRHFLKNLEDGRYDGFPDSGVRTTELISPAYRAERKLPDGETGVVAESVAPGGTAEGALQPGDVILSVDGIDIDNDGSIPIGTVRGPFEHVVDMKQIGEPVRYTVWRGGKKQRVETKTRRIARYDRFRYRYSEMPRFLVYGGLVFMPLDVEYLRTNGKGWPGKVPRSMAWHHFFKAEDDPARADEETVVLARVLQHPVNSGLSVSRSVLEKVNGKPVTSLVELDLALAQARKSGGEITLQFADDFVEVLRVSDTEKAHPEILKTYGVRYEKNL